MRVGAPGSWEALPSYGFSVALWQVDRNSIPVLFSRKADLSCKTSKEIQGIVLELFYSKYFK
jgi:hypothetical protein